jgi:cytochrome c6
MNHRMVRTGSGVLLFAALALAVAVPAHAQDAATLFKTKCAACHGADGKGDSPMAKKLGVRDLSSPEVQKQTDDELFAIIQKGKNKMPAYGKSLNDSQVKGLVAYIRDLAKK